MSSVSQNPRPVNPSRRDDLIVMLLHGGAASPEIAARVVDALQAELLDDATNWLREVGEKDAAYLLGSVYTPGGAS